MKQWISSSLFSQPGAVVGFDTEWRPTMCRAGTEERFVYGCLDPDQTTAILDFKRGWTGVNTVLKNCAF